jgi:hypothetical protein
MSTDLATRTYDVCDQLTRYGGAVFNEELATVLDGLAELNDDLHHDRAKSVIQADLDKLRANFETLYDTLGCPL